MQQNFFQRILKKPPVIFPWVALFHVLATVYSIWDNSTEPFPSVAWVQPLWMIVYTITWLFICDMKRWAAYTYVGITSLSLLLRFFLKSNITDVELYSSVLFPMDVIFSFFVLFYFKRFD